MVSFHAAMKADRNFPSDAKAATGLAAPSISCGDCPIRIHTVYSPSLERDPDVIRALRREAVTVPAKRVIHRQGEAPTKAFTLYDGWAFRFALLPDGQRQILAFLFPGHLISMQAMYLGVLPFSVQALTAVSLCAFDLKELKDFMENDPALMQHLAFKSAQCAVEADNRIISLGRRSAMERIATLILKFTTKLKMRECCQGETFPFPVRQEHIADALGMTPVHVSRTLSTLRDNRVISLGRNTITIIDRQALIELSGNKQLPNLT